MQTALFFDVAEWGFWQLLGHFCGLNGLFQGILWFVLNFPNFVAKWPEILFATDEAWHSTLNRWRNNAIPFQIAGDDLCVGHLAHQLHAWGGSAHDCNRTFLLYQIRVRYLAKSELTSAKETCISWCILCVLVVDVWRQNSYEEKKGVMEER